MKRTDIKIGKQYVAETGYRSNLKVTVLEVGVERDKGYGARRVTKDGVRVRFEQDDASYRKRAAGSEHVLATRAILRPWTAKDDEDDARVSARNDRRASIQERLQRLDVNETGFLVDADTTAAYAQRGSDMLSLTFPALELLLDRAEGSR